MPFTAKYQLKWYHYLFVLTDSTRKVNKKSIMATSRLHAERMLSPTWRLHAKCMMRSSVESKYLQAPSYEGTDLQTVYIESEEK